MTATTDIATDIATDAVAGVAMRFFDACETGQGWDGCARYCHPDASFSAQSEALAEVTSVEGYTNWMQGLLGFVTGTRYELKAFAHDAERSAVLAYAVFSGTHTGEGGPCPPTGKSAHADYVYCMEFVDGRIAHLTKIWHSGMTMRELGWA